ncbi:MAG TPA: putative sulfate exporter family transporter [Acetobacteraceae bacterium]|nr:putative sulfate exporter family transporter [Acetobacteraceae bacterium]
MRRGARHPIAALRSALPLGHIGRLLPGLLLCIAVTAVSAMLARLEAAFLGRAWLEALVLAILVGTSVRTAWTPGERWRAGINFSAKTLLELAVLLLSAFAPGCARRGLSRSSRWRTSPADLPPLSSVRTNSELATERLFVRSPGQRRGHRAPGRHTKCEGGFRNDTWKP